MQDYTLELQKAFNEFKDTIDNRMSKLEHDDRLVEQKLENLNTMMDNIQTKGDKNDMFYPGSIRSDDSLVDYVMHGKPNMDTKAVNPMSSSDDSGSQLIADPSVMDILRVMKEYSPMRSIASVSSVNHGDKIKIPVTPDRAVANWVKEDSERPITEMCSFQTIVIPMHEICAMPAITNKLFMDSREDMYQTIVDIIADSITHVENDAFINGDGVDKPIGLLHTDHLVKDKDWEWGKIGYFLTGKDNDFRDDYDFESLFDLVYSIKPRYLTNACWLMPRSVLRLIRGIKDKEGRYIWQPTQDGQSSLLGYKVCISDDMPHHISDNPYSIAFGDFSRAYRIVDRLNMRILRDPYSHKPNIAFYVIKRVGGGIVNYEAVKLLKFHSE